MEFVAGQLFDDHKFRALALVDIFSGRRCGRHCLMIHVGQSLKGNDVVEIMDHLKAEQLVTTKRIQVDNGSEFISKSLDKWAYDNQVTLGFSRPGKQTDNPSVKSFNGSFKAECLSVYWFLYQMTLGKNQRIGVRSTITFEQLLKWTDTKRSILKGDKIKLTSDSQLLASLFFRTASYEIHLFLKTN